MMTHVRLFRYLCFLLLLSVAFGIAACGDSTPTTAPAVTTASTTQAQVATTQAASSSATTAAASTGVAVAPNSNVKGIVTVWGWKGTLDVLRKNVLDDFKVVYPNVTINFVEYKAEDVYQKLPLALSAGTGAPDISLVENSHLGQLVDLGGLTNLSEKVKPYLDKMNKFKWIDAQKDNKYYAMPWDSGPVVMYYRRDVFQKAGLKDDPDSVSAAVATWDDYLKTCQTIKDKTGFACFDQNKANNDARLYEMILWQQGKGYYDAKGNITVDSPENVATLEKLGTFWKANLLSDQEAWGDPWVANLNSADKPVATIVEASWLGGFLKSFIAPKTEGKWGVAQMPAFQSGQVRASNDGGSSLVIPEQSQNKEAAWAFIEFALGRDQSQIKMFKNSDFFPSLETTYRDTIFGEPDSYYAGQKSRELYSSVAKVVPTGYIYGPRYSQMNAAVRTAIQKYALGSMSASDALKEAATIIRQQTKS